MATEKRVCNHITGTAQNYAEVADYYLDVAEDLLSRGEQHKSANLMESARGIIEEGWSLPDCHCVRK